MTTSRPTLLPLVTSQRLLCLLAVIVLLQLFLAYRLDLYSDEIFYWQASTHPAPGYSDLPFMTALLAGLGAALAPGQALGVRLPFILLGAVVPWLVYWVARPIVGRQQALEAAALSLCLPLAGFLGLLAVPDVPLICFGLLAVGLLERAVRTDAWAYWAAAGIAAACGFSTHYRFFPYALAVLLFLCMFQRRQQWWKWKGLWLAISLSSLGLLPIVWFNLEYDLSSLGFYLVDRHPWQFQAQGLLHMGKQALLVTPPLYIVLALTLWHVFLRARDGDRSSALFFCISTVNIGVYLILAPWTDSTSTSIHWPLSGYLPLLVYAPTVLRECQHWLGRRFSPASARRLVLAIPGLGLLGTLLAFVGVGSQGFLLQLQPLPIGSLLSDKMAGWKEFSAHTNRLLEQQFDDARVVVVTDNYYTSAQVEFGAGKPVLAYTIDTDKANRDGRAAQYAIWQRDLGGLADVAGRDALFITEDSTLTVPDKYRVLRTMCAHTARLQRLEQLNQFRGMKRFSYYRATGIGNPDPAAPCPFPSQGWIDAPTADARVTGILQVSGWVFNEDIGVRRVSVLLDGEEVGLASYGIPRPDVVAAMNVLTDPGRPNLGFEFSLDTTGLSNGARELAIRIENAAGEVQDYGSRRIFIAN